MDRAKAVLRRKISEALLEWKRTKTNQGLLVTGARQVGKTSSIELFAAENYENMVKIDFVERPEAIELIGAARCLEDLVVRITALASKPLPDGNREEGPSNLLMCRFRATLACSSPSSQLNG